MEAEIQPTEKQRRVTLAMNAVALTIAGSDPCGGAGLQADLKTFQQLGVYGMSVVTLITVQNTQAVRRVEVLSPELILEQLDAVLEDIEPRAIKIGALGNAEVVRAVGERLQKLACPIVVDPVMVSKHGHSLVADDVVDACKRFLLPHATLVTPNRFEAERLTGLTLDSPDQVAKAIYLISQTGVRHVLIKLGNVEGEMQHVINSEDGNRCVIVPSLEGKNTHGSGCVLAAAITASLALGEESILEAVEFGVQRAFEALQIDNELGGGIHPAEVRAMSRWPSA